MDPLTMALPADHVIGPKRENLHNVTRQILATVLTVPLPAPNTKTTCRLSFALGYKTKGLSVHSVSF